MGFVNNQWLKGRPERNRPHGPVRVVINAEEADHPWDKENGVVIQLSATRPNGDYQHVLLTADEVQQFVTFLLGNTEVSSIATRTIAALPDSALLKFFGNVLAARSANHET